MIDKSELTCVAAIAGGQGVHGNLKIRSFTEDPIAFASYGPLLSEAGEVIVTPIKARPVGKYFTLSVEEKLTREEAMALKSTKVYVPRSVFPKPEADDFYYADLVGLEVKSTAGKRLGTVIGVHEFGAGDMLEIKPPKSEEKQASYFHPFTKAAVPKVDIKAGRVVIEPQIVAE